MKYDLQQLVLLSYVVLVGAYVFKVFFNAIGTHKQTVD